MSKNELIPFKPNNVFGKIISFFKKLFLKNRISSNEEQVQNINIEKETKSSFKENILIQKETKDDIDMKLLEQYRNGDITEEEMTDEQYECLCNTYKETISKLKESNKKRKAVLLEYRKKLQTNS